MKSPSAKNYLTRPVLNPLVFPTSRTLDRFNDLHTLNRFTSACSPLVIRSDALGQSMQSSALICEPVHNLVSRISLGYDDVAVSGSRFPDEQDREFLTSTDNWFRPVRLMTGPNGGLWICDMYRHVIEHPEWIPEAWQSSLDLYAGSDKGRIYRVLRRGDAVNRPLDFSKLTDLQLVDQLTSANGWDRDMAQQLLVERLAGNNVVDSKSNASGSVGAKTILTAIDKICHDSSLATPIRIQAVWTYSLLQTQSMPGQENLIAEDDPHFVANTIRALKFDSMALQKLLNGNSPTRLHPVVQFEIALTASRFGNEEKQAVLSTLATMNSENKWIRAAILSSAVGVAESVLMEHFRNVADSKGRSELAVGLIDTALAEDPAAGFGRLVLLAKPREGKFEDWQLLALASCLDNLRRRGLRVSEMSLSKPAIGICQAAFELAFEVSSADDEPIERRILATQLLAHATESLGTARSSLVELLSPQTNLALQSAAVDSLASLGCAEELIDLIPNCGPTIQSEIQSKLLSRPKWTMGLLSGVNDEAIEQGHLNPATIQALLTHRDTEIRQLAEQLIGARSSSSDRQSLVERYVMESSNDGASDAGLAIFKQHCASCHQHRGVGQNIAPNLSALEGKNVDYLIRSILDPNAAIEWKYKSYNVLTVDGLSYNGMVLEESATSLKLASADGKQTTILLTDIDEMKNSSLSFMPEGFEKSITPRQMSDLLAFIRSR